MALLLPANNNPTGLCDALFVTINEPESPPALKVPGVITIWLVKVTVVFLPPPQLRCILNTHARVNGSDCPVVNPVVRPLLATDRPIVGFTIVLRRHANVFDRAVTNPFGPALTARSAASTFDGPSGADPVKSATTVAMLQLLSIKPGCETSSPATACPLRPST